MATVVVTGATGAIGSAAVAALEKRRAQVIALSRPAFDLSSMTSVRAAARELNRSRSHIDALLNIAAVYVPRYRKSADGLELMLAVNHLGPFPAQAGTTGWFFKGTRRIDPPKSTLDANQQAALWKRSAELVELEGGF